MVFISTATYDNDKRKSTHAYDDAFKTLRTDCPELLIPVTVQPSILFIHKTWQHLSQGGPNRRLGDSLWPVSRCFTACVLFITRMKGYSTISIANYIPSKLEYHLQLIWLNCYIFIYLLEFSLSSYIFLSASQRHSWISLCFILSNLQ